VEVAFRPLNRSFLACGESLDSRRQRVRAEFESGRHYWNFAMGLACAGKISDSLTWLRDVLRVAVCGVQL
jgi:hypothetical protein